MEYGISIDIGTSGISSHAVDLSDGRIISTAMTSRNPLPGANVMDHLTFCIRYGEDLAHRIMMSAVNRVLENLRVDLKDVRRVAICGNPIQLSIFQGMGVDDLAFAGETAHRVRGIKIRNRDSAEIPATDVGLNVPDGTPLFVPPAIKHEIGADALAMMYKSNFLEGKGIRMVTDYGTNAEMALNIDGEIYTGSAAAGPAMEGQSVERGMLASPGAISDLEYEFQWRCMVLDDEMIPRPGDKIDLATGSLIEEGDMHGKAVGITGTGVVAAVAAAIHGNMWKKGRLTIGDMRLQDGVKITSNDISETCKAIGAIRAGHFTLIEHAGIGFDDMKEMIMSGASGTYVDAAKAREVGMVPPLSRNIYQIGNTSLAMATDIIRRPELLDELQGIADSIRSNHVMFATDKVFEEIYIQELAYWEEGMTLETYNRNLSTAGIQALPRPKGMPNVHRIVVRDIPVFGDLGMHMFEDIGTELTAEFEGCTLCHTCVDECPEDALQFRGRTAVVRTKDCLGTACGRCQLKCPEKVFKYEELRVSDTDL
ncbi:MAG: methylamine methyltransferase corrinoid protein reductive activase [Thermoplasmatales archaeon]|nr:methylamine methyltransferase corrinoid protein reductive activase [Thermoplasmatales archaeon]